jgi:hypothetical protein
VLADSLRAVAARLDVVGSADGPVVDDESVEGVTVDGFAVEDFPVEGFAVEDAVADDFAAARLAAAAEAGRFAVPEDAAGFFAPVARLVVGFSGSAAVVSTASSAAVVAEDADARLAAVDRAAPDFAVVDLVDDFTAADLDADDFAALDLDAADFAAAVRPLERPEARPDPSRPCSGATTSPRGADTPVSVPSGVSSSGPDRETEVTTTTYQPARPQPWTSHSEFTSRRPEPRSWAKPGRLITILLRLGRNPQRPIAPSGIL